MQVSATISVKPDKGEKPDRAKVEEAARLLKQHGFDVVRIGRFGVSVKGSQTDFARVLGVDAAPNQALVVPANPSQPELHDLIDRIEVATDPQLY
jgi:hypothetical protein